MSYINYNDDLIDYLSGGSLDPEFSHISKQRDLKEDWRLEKIKTSDHETEWKEFKEFEQTPLNKYVKIGTELLSSEFDTDATALQNTLKKSYVISESLSRDVVKNLAYDNKNVESHTELFTDNKNVKLRRK